MGFVGLIRLIAIALLAWLLFRGIKNFLAQRSATKQRRNVNRKSPQEVELMVEDPQCHTYLPQKDAVHLYYKGQDLYFCSQKCLDEYKAAQKNS